MFKYRLNARAGDSSNPIEHSVEVTSEDEYTEDELHEMAIEFMWDTVQPEIWFEALNPDDPAEEGDA